MQQKVKLLFVFCFMTSLLMAQPINFEFTKAGYLQTKNSGREVYNFNSGWRYLQGDIDKAEQPDFNDEEWEIVNVPHGLELNSDNASGGANYQGEAWYRKHFTLPFDSKDRKLILHFESIMGKCKVWINGEFVTDHFGGFLPFEVNLSAHLKEGDNVIAVWADNSNDPLYPPGKPQEHMDFAYFGGIYRDVWLVSTGQTYITNSNTANKVAGGGVFINYEKLSESSVDVNVKSHVANEDIAKTITVHTTIKDTDGKLVGDKKSKLVLGKLSDKHIKQTISIKSPKLWTPDTPTLYTVTINLLDKDNKRIDGVRLKQGIRKIEFKGRDGFFLNNEPFQSKLIGVNRHQDHAYVGNALPNNMTLRDVMLIKNAGCNIIRAAHYPTDPSFMDACDALGIFFIVATPGWQFWNDDPIFEKRVISDIRQMVRRDRNYASVIMWEPILNETWYPKSFAQKACMTVHEEYPYEGAYTASDDHAKGSEYSDITYSHVFKGNYNADAAKATDKNYQKYAFDYTKDDRSLFVREWGDAVDNWSAHNSMSRTSRAWGEQPQLIQAKHFEQSDIVYSDYETVSGSNKQHVGGTLWCGFDHQRGYHPEPFYGGLTDVFRQAKYSYYFFASQKDPKIYEPMIHIAHEMTPFSSHDMTIYSNCEEVRLIRYDNDVFHMKRSDMNRATPHPSFVFKDVYNFFDARGLHYSHKANKAHFVAEGLIDGKVVARHKITMTQKVTKIKLERLMNDIPFVANGSDFITIVASITDEEGNIARLNNGHIKFEIEGKGEIIDNGKILANPRMIEFGTAPVLIRSTNEAGEIKVKAYLTEQGINKAAIATLTIKTTEAITPTVYTEERVYNQINAVKISTKNNDNTELEQKVKRLEKELNNLKLKEVEKQQDEFIGI